MQLSIGDEAVFYIIVAAVIRFINGIFAMLGKSGIIYWPTGSSKCDFLHECIDRVLMCSWHEPMFVL